MLASLVIGSKLVRFLSKIESKFCPVEFKSNLSVKLYKSRLWSKIKYPAPVLIKFNSNGIKNSSWSICELNFCSFGKFSELNTFWLSGISNLLDFILPF